MSYAILFNVWVLGGVAMLCGAENSIHPIFQMPVEVINLIIEKVYDPTQFCYKMHDSREEDIDDFLLIPYTLRSISPVKAVHMGPWALVPNVEDTIYLNHQLWVSRYEYKKIMLHDDVKRTRNCFILDLSSLKLPYCITADITQEPTFGEFISELSNTIKSLPQCMRFFDGINKKCCVLYATTNENLSTFFLLQEAQEKDNSVEQEATVSPFLCTDNGLLKSVLLHPERNRVVYSMDHSEKMPDGLPYAFSIVDVENNHPVYSVSLPMDILITKAIYLGKNTYLTCTDKGLLATVWLDEKNSMYYAVQKGVSKVKDIAVDNSYQTPSGFKPRIAYINKAGDVFVTDLTEFGKPTMMYNTTVPNPANVFRLFYDKEKLAVLYRAQNKYGDFLVWPDNLGLLYLKTVLNQMAKKSHDTIMN